MGIRTLNEIKSGGASLKRIYLHPGQVFEIDGTDENGKKSQLLCSELVTLDTELNIRHGSSPPIQNL